MKKDKKYYDGIINSVNVLMEILKHKPRELKCGYQCSPGGILNAYREGDVTFNEAVKQLEDWKDRQVSRAGVRTKGGEFSGTNPDDDLRDQPVEEMALSVQACNCLNNANIYTIGELRQKTEADLVRSKCFSRKVLTEIRGAMQHMKLSFRVETEG